MTRLFSLSNLGRGFAVATALACFAYSAAADRVIQPFRVFQSGPAVITSTASVFPQIQPIRPSTRNISENEPKDTNFTDPPNSLKPGQMMTTKRGTPKISFGGPAFTGYYPPDCDMAVGPNHVVACVNVRIAFYSKTGVKTFEQDMNESGFFSGIGGNSEVYSDPKVFYDVVSGRWFVFIIEVNGFNGGTEKSRVLCAVSDDNNPNGSWAKYSFEALVNGAWLDYPTVGMNKDGIAIGGNMFGFSSGGGFSQLIVVPKAPLLTGSSATVTSFQDNQASTINPARSWDNVSDKLYCAARGNGSTIRLYAIGNTGSTPALVSTTVTVPTYSLGTPSPSAGGGQLDGFDSRLFTCWNRSGKLVTAHSVTTQANPANHVRWYQISLNSWPTSGQPSLAMSGEINLPGGAHSHMPAIATNTFGDISVAYTRSSSSIAADFVTSSRTSADPPGVMGAPVLLKGSTGTYNAGRWGDYFSVAVDPADDSTFWAFGMEILNGSWQTSVHSYVVSTGSATGTVVDATSITTTTGTYIVGDPSSVALSDDIYYQIGSVPITQLGQGAAAEADFVIPSGMQQMTIRLEAVGGVSGGTNMVWLFNWITGQYVLIGSVPLAASGNAAKTLTVRPSELSRYVGAGGAVKALVRGHFPKKPFGAFPLPFTYRIDQLQLLVR